MFAKPIVEGLLKTAEKFSQELKNHTVTPRCEMKYKEVLCRLIDACSPNGFYYLHYITLSECEQMISCVKAAGFSEEITSVCSNIPSTEYTENIAVRNPYVHAELLTTTAPDYSTNGRATKNRPTNNIPTKNSPSNQSPSNNSPTNGVSTTSANIPTSETLEEPATDENEKKNQVGSNNTKMTKDKKSNPRGDASRNYQNLYLFIMILTLLV